MDVMQLVPVILIVAVEKIPVVFAIMEMLISVIVILFGMYAPAMLRGIHALAT